MAVLIRIFSSRILTRRGGHKHDPWRNPIERNHVGLYLEKEVAVVKTPTIISKKPCMKERFVKCKKGRKLSYLQFYFNFNLVFKRQTCYTEMTDQLKFTIHFRKSHRHLECILQLLWAHWVSFVRADLHISLCGQQDPKYEIAIRLLVSCKLLPQTISTLSNHLKLSTPAVSYYPKLFKL